MAITPKMGQGAFELGTETIRCPRCGNLKLITQFAATHNKFYPNGRIPLCHSCVTQLLAADGYSWDSIDRVCRWADIPFIVKEWTTLAETNGEENTWPIYSKVFASAAYESLGWQDYNNQYKALREAGNIGDEIPLLHEQEILNLQRKWGANYAEEDLYYLEDLYKGLCMTQNIAGPLQDDQAKKICKLSYEIDSCIRAGNKDVEKFLSSYDKLIKTAEFTPKNTKNATDFDSWAELAVWLEKKGRLNKFYDDVTRDVVDETLKNIQSYNQKLYINEGGVGEAITERLQALAHANSVEESIYNIGTDFDPDKYDNEGYVVAGEDDAFIIDEDEGGD